MRYLLLFCLLCACAAPLCAQLTRPEISTRGDTLFSSEAKAYQWYKDGNLIPGATARSFVMTEPGVYTVTARSLTSEPLVFKPALTVVVTGAVLDEFLRPINGAEVAIAGAKTNTDANGRFFLTPQRAERLAARAQVAGFHAHTVGFMPTAGDTQFVMIHLAKSVVTHKLPAAEGGTISQGGFWLTLPPNSVVTADGLPYNKGEILLSVTARRPGDRDFAQRMPGGDFMAVDAAGESKILYSYGFTGVEMQTADGKPLNLAPGQNATIEFLITEEQRPGAPAEMPLWHFDEDKGLWVESGMVRKEGLTYKAQVGHFSWWNCDRPYPPAYIEGNVVDCKGNPVMGGKIVVNQREAATDNEGRFNGTVPATIDLDFRVVNTDTTLTPLAAEETRPLGTFKVGWGQFEAIGLADTNKLLTVFAYGETEGVEYSLDGENWQSETTFELQGDSLQAQGWARQEGCDTTRIAILQPLYFNDCRMYDMDSLNNLKRYLFISEVLSATEPVYRINFLQMDDIAPLLHAARLQPCVQELEFWESADPPAILTAAVNELCGLWPNLQKLNLMMNQLTTVPASIGNLTNLQTLDLGDNQLATLPESLGNLTNLQSLDLVANQLTSVPESLGNLTTLQSLDLGINKLTTLPESLGNLTNLQTLSLSGNGLTSIPTTLGNLTNLKILYLSNNQLTNMPESMGNLTNLQYLGLSNNQLTSAPESLGRLTRLQSLELGGNQLTIVPESLGNIPNLQRLYLDQIQLTSVPEWLGNMTNLQTLNLNQNQLTTLPASFANLSQTLKYLYLSGNPISPEEKARIRVMLPNTSITF